MSAVRVSISLDTDHHRGRYLNHQNAVHEGESAAGTSKAQVGFERPPPAIVQNGKLLFLLACQCLHIPSWVAVKGPLASHLVDIFYINYDAIVKGKV